MRRYVRLLRPHQYVKNGFVLLGIVFAQSRSPAQFAGAALAFLAFCLVASAVYVFNDIVDAEADRQHPTKRLRPVASGAVAPRNAGLLGAALALIGVAAALAVSPAAAGFVVLYLLVNAAYSWRLKHVVVLDVFLIAAGFMLRILTGTVGLGIAPSNWLLLTGLMLTLFLGFAKRRAELRVLESGGRHDAAGARRVLGDYSPAVLDQLTGITAACAILAYGLYSLSPETVHAHGAYGLFATLPLVIYGMFRYLFLLHQREGGSDTARDMLTDPHLIVTGLAWAAVTLAVLA